jgi:hypothetical protein
LAVSDRRGLGRPGVKDRAQRTDIKGMRSPLLLRRLASSAMLVALAATGSFVAADHLGSSAQASGQTAGAPRILTPVERELRLQRAAYHALVAQLGSTRVARTPAGRTLAPAIHRAERARRAQPPASTTS